MARTETGWRWVSKLVTGYFREGPGYACWRSDGTTDWLLTYTVAGLGRYGHSLGDLICRPGQLVLLRPQTLHDYGVEATQQSWEFVWAHFHPRPDWLQLLTWSEEAPGLMTLDLAASSYREKIARRFIEAHEHATLSGPHSDDLAMNALEEVLLWCAMVTPGAQAALDPRVTLAMNHCCRNLAVRHLGLAAVVPVPQPGRPAADALARAPAHGASQGSPGSDQRASACDRRAGRLPRRLLLLGALPQDARHVTARVAHRRPGAARHPPCAPVTARS